MNGQPVKYLMGKITADDFLVGFTEAQHTFIDQLENPAPVEVKPAETPKPEPVQQVAPMSTETTTTETTVEDDGKKIHSGLSLQEQTKR